MFLDARDLADGTELDTDLCIVGAGAAGITLARELAGSGLRLVLLESGGFRPEPETQALMKGASVGVPYYPLESDRLRYFGGTTNHWAGASRPLDPWDFEPRDWVPYSGWPLTRADLEPYYRRAHEILQLGPYAYEAVDWATPEAPELRLPSGRLATGMLQVSPPTRFGVVYRGELDAAQSVRVYLHANLVDLDTAPDGGAVRRFHCACLGGRRFSVRARSYVLAAGAIENARLLLASNRVRRAGVGNDHDLVGRCFMDHIAVPGAVFLPSDPAIRLGLYQETAERGAIRTGFLMPTAATQRRDRIVNIRVFLTGAPEAEVLKASSAAIRQADRALDALRTGNAGEAFGRRLWSVVSDLDDLAMYAYRQFFYRGPTVDAYYLHAHIEQAPNRDSRVTLSSDRDALGVPRVRLDWHFGIRSRKSLRRAYQLLAEDLGAGGLGRVRVLPDDVRLEGDIFVRGVPARGWPAGLRGSHHQIGTTRMASDAAEGVVNADCRMHGVRNLYIAGGSVFPTCGSTNPTLTIVALALRLADHVKQNTV